MGEAFAAAIVILHSVGFLYFIGPAMATITAFPEGSGDETTSTNLSRNLVLMVKVGIPTGFIGAAAGFLSGTD